MGVLAAIILILQALVHLAATIAGVILLRRLADPGVKFLLAWGGFGLIMDLHNLFFQLLYSSGQALPSWVNLLSGIEVLLGQLLTYSIVLYAIWRFWRAAQRPGA